MRVAVLDPHVARRVVLSLAPQDCMAKAFEREIAFADPPHPAARDAGEGGAAGQSEARTMAATAVASRPSCGSLTASISATAPKQAGSVDPPPRLQAEKKARAVFVPGEAGKLPYSTVTCVFTELAMKQISCASWCRRARACLSGALPAHSIFGLRVTLVIACRPGATSSNTPSAWSS